MVLLSAEQSLNVSEIPVIVRESEVTIQRWLKRYLTEDMDGLKDTPRSVDVRVDTQSIRLKERRLKTCDTN